ncbi:MAG: D-2-hydroxyacid dehydrogenase [Halodesulfurarchaeum sp.]
MNQSSEHDASLEIGLLRTGAHGLTVEAYAEEIRERLPETPVSVAKTPRQERELIESVPIISGPDIDEDRLREAENLRLFACTWAGTDHLPMEALADRNVTVTNASGIHAPNIAETVLGHILAFARGLPEAWRRTERREWRHFQVDEFAGSTVTVVGQGAIGTAVLERLSGFDVDSISIRYTPEKGGPADTVLGFDFDDLHEALSRTDYLVIASPLTETTAGLIGPEEFATLPPDAVLVNVSRGGIVDTDALVDALQSQHIGGAALDVTDPEPLPEDHPLWGLQNVVITPHNAGHTPEHWPRLADIVANNVSSIRETGEFTGLENQVLPDS